MEVWVGGTHCNAEPQNFQVTLCMAFSKGSPEAVYGLPKVFPQELYMGGLVKALWQQFMREGVVFKYFIF